MSKSNNTVWMGRRYGRNIQAVPAHIENQEQYAGEFLTVTQIEILHVWSYAHITAHYEIGKDFILRAYPAERDLFAKAGYVLPTAHGKHKLDAMITTKFVLAHGEWRLAIVTVESRKVESKLDAQLALLSAMRSRLATDASAALGLHGAALDTAVARANATYWIDCMVMELRKQADTGAVVTDEIETKGASA